MKRLFLLITIFYFLINITACTKSIKSDIDIDLTKLSSTMAYSEVLNMLESPEKYTGKKVKMEGSFNLTRDEENDKNYCACIIYDSTSCCVQRMEFELSDKLSFPDGYPSQNSDITVVGYFETYENNGYSYCRLNNAKIVSDF